MNLERIIQLINDSKGNTSGIKRLGRLKYKYINRSNRKKKKEK